MRARLKVQDAHCFGRGGLVGKVTPLLSASVCGRSIIKTRDHLSPHGYRPVYLPDPLSMQIGEAGIEEPMWIYLSFMRRAQREGWFTEHPIGVREITRLTLTTPMPLRSNASQKIIENGVLATRTRATSLLEIEFDGHRRKEHADFRPHLPVIFQL
jgi:hypothetical protein